MGTSQPPTRNEGGDREAVARSFVSAAELISSHELARVYTDILLNQPTSNSAVATRLDLPESTTSKRIGKLRELGIVIERGEGRENELHTDSIVFTVQLNESEMLITPTVIAAYGAKEEIDEIDTFLTRHSRAKLIEAIRHTIAYLEGKITRRSAGVEMDISSVEAISITQELEPIITLLQDVDDSIPELEHDVHGRKVVEAPYVLEGE